MNIIPHLWFDKEAKEAVEFYVATFPDSRITRSSKIRGTPSGDCDILSFELAGQPMMAINAGPYFKFTPAISFFLNFDPSSDPKAKEHLDATWAKLSEGGEALMPLDEYPFSKRYGWIRDRYGVSWQLILSNPEGEARPFIVPSLMFTGEVAGKAEEAIDRYIAIFGGKRGTTARYGPGMPNDKEGTLMFADFMIGDTWIAAMDSAHPHGFGFTEATSLIVPIETQEEIERYSDALSAVPEAEQCGWIKDAYGVSWQIWPKRMEEMMTLGTQEAIDRVTKAFLPMKRFDLAKLEAAWRGE